MALEGSSTHVCFQHRYSHQALHIALRSIQNAVFVGQGFLASCLDGSPHMGRRITTAGEHAPFPLPVIQSQNIGCSPFLLPMKRALSRVHHDHRSHLMGCCICCSLPRTENTAVVKSILLQQMTPHGPACPTMSAFLNVRQCLFQQMDHGLPSVSSTCSPRAPANSVIIHCLHGSATTNRRPRFLLGQ